MSVHEVAPEILNHQVVGANQVTRGIRALIEAAESLSEAFGDAIEALRGTDEAEADDD